MAEYIKREALREILDGWREAHADVDDVHGCDLLEDVICEVDAQTAADVAPVVHGRWIEDHDYLKCPECSVMVKWDFTFFDIGNWNYCPNCGVKMQGAGNE